MLFMHMQRVHLGSIIPLCFICTYYYGLSPLELSIASENAISVASIVSLPPSYYLSLLLFPDFAHSH